MDLTNITFIPYITKDFLFIRIKCKTFKFKDIKIKLEQKNIEDFKKCKYKLEQGDKKDDKINFIIKIIKDDRTIHEEKIFLLNVKYYLTNGPFNKRVNEKPFYSYIENKKFNLEDITTLLKREKIDDIYKIDSIKIKKTGENVFENMSNNEYSIDECGFITLELHFNEMKESKNLINSYNNEIIKIYNKLNKDSENVKKYDLIYLYASPLVIDDSGKPSTAPRISYREEIKIILDLMKKKKKKFKCLFKCASAEVIRDVLNNKKTKVLHISSHGIINNKNYSLILENLENCGQKQIVEKNTLQSILQYNPSNINNINLIVLSTCHSGGFQELFTQICKPKNIVYVNKKDPIADIVCVSFVEYFYSELIEGNQINESFEKTIKKLKTNSKILSIVPNPEKEIGKLNLYSSKITDSYISPFKFIGDGEISVNENVKINFNTQKYKSIIGRTPIITHVIKELNNKNEDNPFTIIYGKKGMEKLDFAESLCVYLFERKIIINYEIFNEFEFGDNILEIIESKINEMQKYAKYLQKKVIIIIKIEENEDLIERIKNRFSNFNNCYFIIVIDKEDIKPEIKKNFKNFNALLDRFNAELLFKELYISYGRSGNDLNTVIFNKLFEKLNQKNKKYEPKKISKLVDSYILCKSIDKINIDDNNMERTILLTPLYAYLFILSKMPSGLPDCFVQLIFKDNFDDELISKYTMNNWNYINTDIQFNKAKIVEEIIIQKEGEPCIKEIKQKTFEDFEKYSLEYMLKALKLYSKLLYFYIEKDRNQINYPDENIHFIFNSYNNEGIWKSNIPNIKDKDEINENEFINKDFYIQNHKENIYNLINYLVSKLEYFDEAYIYIDYLLEILLLFPSYFFLKKICKYYIKKCKELCNKCQEHYHKNNEKMKEFFKYQSLEEKINILYKLNNDDINEKEMPFDKDFKSELEILNNYKRNLKNQVKKCKDIFSKWKDNYNKKFEEFERRFINLNTKLSLFLYSIDNEEIINIPEDKELQLELKILQFIKKKNISGGSLIDILEEDKKINNLSSKKKSILCYELAIHYYSEKNIDEAEKYLKYALSFCKGFKFIEHRIEIDLCYIFLNKINSENKEKKSNKKERNSFEKVLEKYIQKIDSLMKDYCSNKLYTEELHLRQEFYDLLQPNTIMLNSNPLKNGYCLLSSGIYAYPNNQYYILDKLNELEKEDKIKSYIRMKSYILNRQNLKEVLKKKGEILIIQSDDFSENGDIILESDEGISERLTKKEFIDITFKKDSKKIFRYKIVILAFINSSKMFDFINKNAEYEYLIYFETNINSLKMKKNQMIEYNKLFVEFIIEFISSYQENNYNTEDLFDSANFDEKINKSILKDNFNYKIVKKGNNIINQIKYGDKGIFFLDPLLKLPLDAFSLTNNRYNDYSIEMFDIIKELVNGKNKSFYCNKSEKEKYLKISFDIIKYFYRHKKFLQFYCIDVEKKDEMELICKDKENKNKVGQKKQKKYFYLVYNCKYYNSLEFLNVLIKNNYTYIIIYDEEDNYNKDKEIDDEIESSIDFTEDDNSFDKRFSALEYKGDYSESISDDDNDVENSINKN